MCGSVALILATI